MRPITELNELKRIELEIMKKLHDFCVQNNIWYVLTYGTLLGAIRHNGFIPWDDDIDIHMTREGFRKFEELFPHWGEAHGLHVVGPHTKGNEFPRDMLKVCDSRTVLMEKAYKNGCKLGVFVDIWPLDKAPSNSSIFDEVWVKTVMAIKRLALASDILMSSDAFQRLNPKQKVFVTLCKNLNAKKLVLIQERLAQRRNDCESPSYISFQANKRFYQTEDLFPAVLHTFEDTELFVPNNSNEILRLTYGDFLKLPPEEERKPHHLQEVYWK